MSHQGKILLIVIAAVIGCAMQAIAQSSHDTSHSGQAAAKHNGRDVKAEHGQAVGSVWIAAHAHAWRSQS
jgi:hypothetical protein